VIGSEVEAFRLKAVLQTHHWQQWRLLRSKRLPTPRRQHCLGVFENLLGGFKVMVVGPVIFVLAILGRVLATDVWTRFVDAAAVVVLQVLTLGMHHQIPITFIDEDGGSIVDEIPTNVLEVFPCFWRIDRQSEVFAAFGGAVVAEIRVGWNLVALWFGCEFGGCHEVVCPK